MDNSIDQWRNALELYFAVKKEYILAEEIDDELSTNIQPLKQLRDALDHIMRVVAVEQGFSGLDFSVDELPDGFEEDNFKSAMDHLYRAFFDVCDSASLSYRDRIIKNLDGFSKEVILTALPDYYPKIRPRIVEIEEEIADMRNSKGQLPNSRTKQASYYIGVLEELKSFYKETTTAQVSLIELQEKEKEKAEAKAEAEKKSKRFQVGLTIGAALLGAVAGVLLTIFFGALPTG